MDTQTNEADVESLNRQLKQLLPQGIEASVRLSGEEYHITLSSSLIQHIEFNSVVLVSELRDDELIRAILDMVKVFFAPITIKR